MSTSFSTISPIDGSVYVTGTMQLLMVIYKHREYVSRSAAM